MKLTIKSLVKSLVLLMISASLSGCFVTMHVVGEGGTYDGRKISEYDVKKKKWYLFAGIPLDEVSANTVAGDAKNYTARETLTFGDLVLNALTFGVASPRTIRISKSAAEK